MRARRPRNDPSACTSGLVAHAVPRRLPASLARIHSQPVQRTLHAQRTTPQHVEIRHRRPHVSVAEQFLHRTNVIPSFAQVRCVPANRALQPRPSDFLESSFDGLRGRGLGKKSGRCGDAGLRAAVECRLGDPEKGLPLRPSTKGRAACGVGCLAKRAGLGRQGTATANLGSSDAPLAGRAEPGSGVEMPGAPGRAESSRGP